MNRIKSFFIGELKGWNWWEITWLLFGNVSILTVSLIMHDTAVGILASVTGITCVILVGKGKVSNYLFGTINIIFYSIIAFRAKYYGDVMLNLLYYLPTNFIGWYTWSRHMDTKKEEVCKERMTSVQRTAVALLSAAGIFGYSYFLKYLGGNLPLVDSMSTVLSIVAQILMIRRYMEQWIIWIIVNIVSVVMWIMAFFNGGESVAVLMMWSVFLVNAVIMFIKWYRDSARQKNEERIPDGGNDDGAWNEI